jgi:hypothetical protein
MLLILAATTHVLLLSELLVRRILYVLMRTARSSLRHHADSSVLASLGAAVLQAATILLQVAGGFVSSLARSWGFLLVLFVLFTALLLMCSISVYTLSTLSRMYNIGVAPFVGGLHWLFMLIDFVFRAVVPVWNGSTHLFAQLLRKVVLPYSFTNAEHDAPPPTREQLNVSHPEYAQLGIKYACMQPPSAWTATVFVFSLETVSLPVESGVAQLLLNALDSMAETLRQRLLASGEGIVLLSVLNEFSHPVPFDEWMRNLRVAQCASNTLSCTESSNLVNLRFLYGSRLLDATLDMVRVQGVLVAPLLPEASLSSRAEQSQVPNIRTVLQTIAQAEQADAVLIRGVQDIDVQEVVVLDSKPAAKEADAELSVTGPAAAAAVFFCLFFVLVFIVIVGFSRTPRLHERA